MGSKGIKKQKHSNYAVPLLETGNRKLIYRVCSCSLWVPSTNYWVLST